MLHYFLHLSGFENAATARQALQAALKWDHTSFMADEKVGDAVWYRFAEPTREMAEIIAIDGKTEATVRLLTGPQKGEELTVPWALIESRSGKMTPDQLQKLRKAIKVNRVIWKLDGVA